MTSDLLILSWVHDGRGRSIATYLHLADDWLDIANVLRAMGATRITLTWQHDGREVAPRWTWDRPSRRRAA